MNKEEILALLAGVREEVKQKFKADIKGIFGSFVRREEKPGSDIDVLVDFDNNANLLDLVGLSLYLEDKLNHRVDVVSVSIIRNEIRDSVMKEIVYI